VAVYQITNKQLLDNYAVVTLLAVHDINIGDSVTIAGVGSPFNGTFTVWEVPEYEFIGVNNQGELMYNGSNPIANQILYKCTGSNVDLVAASGTLTFTATCTWITGTDIADWVGITYASDSAYLDACASASNQFCYRRRAESGNFDSLTVVPGGDAKLGTIMYGGALYRQRGAIDQFASFTEMGTAPVVGLSPVIKQLLGLGAHSVG
jgi:hypothetical protein